MAKGLGGKTYEAIVKLLLENISKDGSIKGNIYWNETPSDLGVEPDFIIGPELNIPDIVIMVTHCDSPKESNRKVQRNIAELIESKVSFLKAPKVYNIIFNSKLKNDMIRLQDSIFDGQIVFGQKDYGIIIEAWVDKHKDSLPKDQSEKVIAIRRVLAYENALKKALMQAEKDLQQVLTKQAPASLTQLWQEEKKRLIPESSIVHQTFVKRGMAKYLLIGNVDLNTLTDGSAEWMIKLGLIRPQIGGYRICDAELQWFINSKYKALTEKIAKKCANKSFWEQIEKVRNFSQIEIYANYLIDNYDSLIITSGMEKSLLSLFENPCSGLTIPDNIAKPTNVWLFDIIASIVKADEHKAQAYGYSVFATHPAGQTSKIGNLTVGEWCGLGFISAFFNRRDDIIAPPEAIHLAAIVLSETLSRYSTSRIVELKNEIVDSYITKEYDDNLLSHTGFSPLYELLVEEKILNTNYKLTPIRTCFAEKAELTGRSGKIAVAISNHTIILCKTAFKNPRDKRKELCSQSVGLRYSWDSKTQSFVKRSGIDKLILLLDGVWGQNDVDALYKAGWDEIYYPDEIDKLKAAII